MLAGWSITINMHNDIANYNPDIYTLLYTFNKLRLRFFIHNITSGYKQCIAIRFFVKEHFQNTVDWKL